MHSMEATISFSFLELLKKMEEVFFFLIIWFSYVKEHAWGEKKVNSFSFFLVGSIFYAHETMDKRKDTKCKSLPEQWWSEYEASREYNEKGLLETIPASLAPLASNLSYLIICSNFSLYSFCLCSYCHHQVTLQLAEKIHTIF